MRTVQFLCFFWLFLNVESLGMELVTNLNEFGDGIFNFKESKEFVEVPEVNFPELNIFCYNGKKSFYIFIEFYNKLGPFLFLFCPFFDRL